MLNFHKWAIDEIEQNFLGGKKTDRIIFAAIPDFKRTAIEANKQGRVSAGAFVSTMLAEEAVRGAKR